MKFRLTFFFLVVSLLIIRDEFVFAENDSLFHNKIGDSLMKRGTDFAKAEKYNLALNDYFAALDHYSKTDNYIQQVRDFCRICDLFCLTKNFDLAKKYLDAALVTSVIIKNDSQIVYPFITLGQYYYRMAKFDSAIFVLYLYMPQLLKKGDSYIKGEMYRLLGDSWIEKQGYGLTTYFYGKAIDEYKKTSNNRTVAAIYARLGNVYWRMGMYERVLQVNLMALKIRKTLHDTVTLSMAYRNVGDGYWLLERNDSALYYYNHALGLTKKIEKPYFREIAYRALRDVAEKDGRYREALEYNKKSLEYRLQFNLEKTHSEILVLEANKSINDNQQLNKQLVQNNLLQELLIKNRKVQTIAAEVTFLAFMTLIFFIDYLISNNRRKKSELLIINNHLEQEIKQNLEAGRKQIESESLHRFLIENSEEVILLFNNNLKIYYISGSCMKLFGYSAAEIIEKNHILSLVETGYQKALKESVDEATRKRRSTALLFKALRKDGKSFWVETTMNPIIDTATGEIVEIMAIFRDYTERKEFEDKIALNARQKEILLEEIHTRVKNNYTILGSLMHLLPSASKEQTLSNSLHGLQLRVRTMSLVHELLYHSETTHSIPFDQYLKDLCAMISGAFNNERIQIHTQTCECNLSVDMTLPLGLIVSELLTNAYKYAFKDNNPGMITVSLDSPDTDRYRISVKDNGVGLPENFTLDNSSSMGTKIISILVQQIEGKMFIESNHGACFDIEFTPHNRK